MLTFVAADQGTIGGRTGGTIAYPTGTLPGDLVVLYAFANYPYVASIVPAAWQRQGFDTAAGRHCAFARIAGAESGLVTTSSVSVNMASYRGVAMPTVSSGASPETETTVATLLSPVTGAAIIVVGSVAGPTISGTADATGSNSAGELVYWHHQASGSTPSYTGSFSNISWGCAMNANPGGGQSMMS